MTRALTTESVRKVYVAAPIITEQNRLNDTDIGNNTVAFEAWLNTIRAEAWDAGRNASGQLVYRDGHYVVVWRDNVPNPFGGVA